MNSATNNLLDIFVTTGKDLEPLLQWEVEQLGITDVRLARSGVEFSGTLEQAYRVCLWSRIANRVLVQVGKYPAANEDELYQAALQIDWRKHMKASQTLAVAASLGRSNIRHSKFAALKVKDAVVDQFRDREGVRPDVRTQQPDLQINVYIDKDEARFSIDLSGDSLHQRGYRTEGGAATLKETLAAAILYRCGWPEVAVQGQAFVDFMCGSGTLPIEAALMAGDIAPGMFREYFGFLGWQQHHPAIWHRLIEEAKYRRGKGLEKMPVIMGFDHHRPTIEKAQTHIAQAGLQDYLRIDFQDVFQFKLDMPKQGLVVVNPPYGKRLGETSELQSLYGAIGKVLVEHFSGWQAAVFTDDQDNGKWVGLRSHKIHALNNGPIACKLLHFEVSEQAVIREYRLPKPIPMEELSEAGAGFKNRLQKNLRQRRRWAEKESISCYRLYDADLPDYAVAVDIYQSDQLLVHIQEYEAPKTVDEKKARYRLREVVSVCFDVLQVPEEQVFLKQRRRQKGAAQYERMEKKDDFHVVTEGQGKFLVNLEDYLDTGLFLDHRPIRLDLFNRANGKRVLNLFAYTASASVHAGLGGAEKTLSVDMSNTYVDWARRNMSLNGLEEKNHRCLRADCLAWLERPTDPGPWDIIFLDPPSFSNSKKMEGTFDVGRDHPQLIDLAMKILKPDGVLIFSNNLRGFKLNKSIEGQYRVADVSAETIPDDFARRKNIHHCFEIRHSGN